MFQGNLIFLDAHKDDDIPVSLDIINDPLVYQYMTPSIIYPMTMNDEKNWVAKQSALNSKELYVFAIRSKKNQEYIGSCGIYSMDRKNSFLEIGIMISPSHHGKGYGNEAMHLLLRFTFEEINVNKVTLVVYSFNEKAIRLYKKMGFVEECKKRQEVYRFGKYHDIIHMGILKKEWIEQQKNPIFIT